MKTLALGLFAAVASWAQLAPPNTAGISMGHLHFLVKDPAVHRQIYLDVLGGQAVKAGTLELVKFPGVLLAFNKGEPTAGTVGSAVDHIGFLAKDLDDVQARLTKAGITVTPTSQPRQIFAAFPDNVRVEFIEDKNAPAPLRFHHVHFSSDKGEEMRAWYVKLFGAVPGVRGRFQAADIPGVNLSWNVVQTAPAATKGRSLDHIGFEVVNLEAFCKKLEEQGIKLDSAYRAVPQLGISIAFLTDPWGTRIELTEGFGKL